ATRRVRKRSQCSEESERDRRRSEENERQNKTQTTPVRGVERGDAAATVATSRGHAAKATKGEGATGK
ncbi:hypothetical protein A2U01_0112533, partial [Trifolium medium]|nr:hypothetical protein [Trifolium medium]